MTIKDWLCDILGCAGECDDALTECHSELALAERRVDELESLFDIRPTPAIRVKEQSPLWMREKLQLLNVQWLQLDGRYFCTTEEDFLNVVAWDWTDSYTYRSDTWDCDKFAVRFKSQCDLHFGLNSVGIVIDYASGHAYNLAVLSDGNIMLLEPQSDQIFCWTLRPKQFYSLTGAFVVL